MSVRDRLHAGFEFATRLAELLTREGVRQGKEAGPYCAVMVIAVPGGKPKKGEAPVGFSLNYDFESSRWSVDVDSLHMMPVEEDGESVPS